MQGIGNQIHTERVKTYGWQINRAAILKLSSKEAAEVTDDVLVYINTGDRLFLEGYDLDEMVLKVTNEMIEDHEKLKSPGRNAEIFNININSTK